MATPQKGSEGGISGLPPRGSLSTPRNKTRGAAHVVGSGPGSGAPTKPPSVRKSSGSVSENLKGIAINFNTIIDIEAIQSGKVAVRPKANAWHDDTAALKSRGRSEALLMTPEPIERRRPADLDDLQQTFIRKNFSFEPESNPALMDSPDPCSKFHSGPGPVPVSPGTPSGLPIQVSPAASKHLTDEAFGNFLASQNMPKQLVESKLPRPSEGVPLIFGSNVTLDSPDPCSKFHSGPGPVPVSPLTPGGPCLDINGKAELTSDAFERFLRASKMTAKQLPSEGASIPLIHGSNVTMDSPDPCSKFHSGPGPVPLSPLTTPDGAVAPEHLRRTVEAMPLIFGCNVTIDSPDVCSKFNKSYTSEALVSEPLSWLGVASSSNKGGIAVIEKAWRHSAQVEEVEKWKVSQPASKHPNFQASGGANTSTSRSTHRVLRHVVSPDECEGDTVLFNQTLSPLKPNYAQICKQIKKGAESARAGSILVVDTTPSLVDAAKATRFGRKVSPASVADDVFSETLSPFKADYGSKCNVINNMSKAGSVRLDFESPQSKRQSEPQHVIVPVRPSPPSLRPTGDVNCAGPKPPSFRRSFTGKDVSNTHTASEAKRDQSPSPSHADVQGDTENAPKPQSGGSGNFRRGRLLKASPPTAPASMLERSSADEVPLRSDSPPTSAFSFSSSSSSSSSLAKRATRTRVTFLQCGYADNIKIKQSKKKKTRNAKFDPYLESLAENFPTLIADYPPWLPTVVADACSIGLAKSIRRITNDGVVVPRASSITSEDEQSAILDSIAAHEEQRQQQQQQKLTGHDFNSTSSRFRRNLLAPLAQGQSCSVDVDTYNAWMMKQTKLSQGDAEIIQASFNGDFGTVQKLIAGLDEAALNDITGAHNGNTLLITAAATGSERIVRLCLSAGIDVNQGNFFGNTALHFTQELGCTGLSELLLKHGASTKIENDMGQCPGQRIKV